MARGRHILHYTLGCDREEFQVELGDEVEFEWSWTGPLTHCGVVTAIYPRKRELRVSYLDEGDWTRKAAEPKRKSAIIPIAVASFIAREL